MKDACDEVCIHNNLSGVNCYEDCDACVTGIEDCSGDCMNDCGDCLCCFCDNAPEDAQEFVCNFVNDIYDCSPEEPTPKEPEMVGCWDEWVC
jgi:hypothetical protein